MSDHDQPVAANLLNQDFTADAPNRVLPVSLRSGVGASDHAADVRAARVSR